jgi:hypothetical protein
LATDMSISKLEIAGKGKKGVKFFDARAFSIAEKATLFAVAISLITGGSQLVRDNFYAGLTVLVVGVALIIAWSILVDREARAEARREAVKAAEKAVLERMRQIEGERTRSSH